MSRPPVTRHRNSKWCQIPVAFTRWRLITENTSHGLRCHTLFFEEYWLRCNVDNSCDLYAWLQVEKFLRFRLPFCDVDRKLTFHTIAQGFFELRDLLNLWIAFGTWKAYDISFGATKKRPSWMNRKEQTPEWFHLTLSRDCRRGFILRKSAKRTNFIVLSVKKNLRRF